MEYNEPSPTRTYVIQLMNGNGGCFFKKFVLPEEYENNLGSATWYFYNRLDFYSCGRGAISYENYSNLVDADKEELTELILPFPNSTTITWIKKRYL
jgi:hypothetical protein